MASNLNLLCDTSSNVFDAIVYIQIIGSLMYLTHTRPYICFAVNTLSQYLVEPRCVHLIVEKHVMRYLNGTLEYGLRYELDQKIIFLAILIHIAPIVSHIGIALQDAALVWGLV